MEVAREVISGQGFGSRFKDLCGAKNKSTADFKKSLCFLTSRSYPPIASSAFSKRRKNSFFSSSFIRDRSRASVRFIF